jgi:uncharacterized membrane protein YGL010W
MTAQSSLRSREQVLLPAPPGGGPNNNNDRPPPYEKVALMASHVFILGVFGLCTKAAFYDFQNVESALAFYGVYHREPLNQVIHFFGVPLIIWTLLVYTAHLVVVLLPSSSSSLPLAIMLSSTSSKQPASSTTTPQPLWTIPSLPGIPAHHMTWATLWVLLYVAFYLKIDHIGALLYMPFLYLYYATAVRWTRSDQQKAVLEWKGQVWAAKDIKEHYPAAIADKYLAPAFISWMGTGSLISWACFLQVFAWYVQVSGEKSVVVVVVVVPCVLLFFSFPMRCRTQHVGRRRVTSLGITTHFLDLFSSTTRRCAKKQQHILLFFISSDPPRSSYH